MLVYNLLGAFMVSIVVFLIVMLLDISEMVPHIIVPGVLVGIAIGIYAFSVLNDITQQYELLFDNIQYEKTPKDMNEIKTPILVIVGEENDEIVTTFKKPLNKLSDYTLIIQNPLDEVGKELIETYHITTIPAILINKNGYTYTLTDQEYINKILKHQNLLTEANITNLLTEKIKEL